MTSSRCLEDVYLDKKHLSLSEIKEEEEPKNRGRLFRFIRVDSTIGGIRPFTVVLLSLVISMNFMVNFYPFLHDF